MVSKTTKNELRCFCSRAPLLAVYGLKDGKLYIHIKIYKQRRIYGEVLVVEGKVKLHCRECLRWHTVTLRDPGTVGLEEDSVPPTLPEEA
jgi:hypothetical protein